MLLTVKECADRLGLSLAMVYALCAARKIRHERHVLGRGAIRVPEDALEDYRRSVTIAVEVGASVPHARREEALTPPSGEDDWP